VATRIRTSRRNDILLAFTSLVAVQGYESTTINQIAEQLELSKGTIMYHFGSKDQMLRQMALDYMERRLTDLASITKKAVPCDIRVRAIIFSLITSYRDDGPAAVAFSREFMRLMVEPLMDEVRLLRQKYLGELEKVIKDGIEEGTFRNTEAKIVALQIIGMCQWTWTWLRSDGSLTHEEIAAIFADSVLNGLSAGTDRSSAIV
jgi:AcrR family transcriptional regulator